MEFKDGMHIFTFEGKDVGSLQRVVIDPEIYEVTHIVIKKGLLSASGKVVPVANISSIDENEIHLKCTADEIEEMAPLVIEEKLPANEGVVDNQTYLPLAGGLYTSPMPEPQFNIQLKRTIPENLVALKVGAHVISADDERIGDIERVDTDPETCRISDIVVINGLLTKVRKTIQSKWVKMFGEDEVYLTIDTHQFDDLVENKD